MGRIPAPAACGSPPARADAPPVAAGTRRRTATVRTGRDDGGQLRQRPTYGWRTHCGAPTCGPPARDVDHVTPKVHGGSENRPTSSRCAVRTTERKQHGSTARSGALGGPESFCLKLGQRPCATHRYMRPPAFLAARAGQRATVAVEYRERGSAPGLPRGTARVPVHERGWSADGLPADDPHVVRAWNPHGPAPRVERQHDQGVARERHRHDVPAVG